ncbi:MAG: glycosyltransferase family 4 protein [Bacteroidales bacterium]
MKNEKLIYIYPTLASFIKKDIDFLSKTYFIQTIPQTWDNKLLIPITLAMQAFRLLLKLNKTKVIIIMFGGYWSLFPSIYGRIFNIPVFIILGGTDCVSFPSINYGSLRKPLLKLFIKWSYQLCKRLVPVDESLVYNNYFYFEPEIYKEQGYKVFFPKIKTQYTVIPNGFDYSFWGNRSIQNKNIPNSFVTVANVSDNTRFLVKGIDVVIELAKYFPKYSFKIIGISESYKSSLNIPKNVICYSFLASEQVKNILAETEFYLQLSISEGFPNALCEAMLSGCIPIGSNVGAIPKIISDTGFVINKKNLNEIFSTLTKITSLNDFHKKELANNARQRIIDNFDISKREQAFCKLISAT